jgi:hypothetical protein
VDKIASIALAVVSLATIAVLIRNGQNTSSVINSATTGFANVLTAAMGGASTGVG